jgi:hypothetical protein
MRTIALPIGLLVLAAAGLFGRPASVRADDSSPTYMNAEVLRFDPLRRLITVRKPLGSEETMELDERLAGFGDVAPGDDAILTVRRQPGRAWVSAIMKATPKAPDDAAASDDLHALPPAGLAGNATPRQSFAVQVELLSQRASRVDGLWNSFRSSCGARVRGNYEGAREWFGFWDDAVRSDLSSGFCRDLYNRIVDLGEGVKAAMVTAEDVARATLPAGSIREIRRHYAMDWDGWDRVPPARQSR